MNHTLSLPSVALRTKTGASGRTLVYDPQRKRYVTLTAEEWVRQHFVAYLVSHKGYPAALIANEVSVEVCGVRRRSDTIVYSPLDGHPLIVIEYKAPGVSITQEVFAQIQSYNAQMHADYLIVSNGIRHFCCHNDYAAMTAQFLPDIPDWSSLIPPK